MTQAIKTEQAMRWVSSLSLKTHLEDAMRDCSATIRQELGSTPDLVLAFISPHYSKDFDEVPKLLKRFLNPRHVMGCSAGGVIASNQEVEGHAAVGIMAARLPDVDITPFHLEMDALPDMDAPPKAWADAVGIADRAAQPHFIVLGDPFTFDPEDLVRGLDYAFPHGVKVGGLVSGAQRPGANALYLDGERHVSGLVGLAFTGNFFIDPIVAQGCRPVGRTVKITACEQNQLIELDGKPALEALAEMLQELPEEDRELARTSLFVGLLTTPFQEKSQGKDFLVRNIIGLDPERGILGIGAVLRPGQTLRFHLRDKRTSADDLRQRLRGYVQSKPATPPKGALLFSCLGRGEHLYGIPNHDTNAFLKSVGPVAVSGFFCNGEIGPVEGVTYLHGYTSCFAVCRPAR